MRASIMAANVLTLAGNLAEWEISAVFTTIAAATGKTCPHQACNKGFFTV